MQTPLYVRPLLADERAILETGLRSSSAFTLRRCQILLASAEGQVTTTIAHDLRCTEQTVRNALHAFHQRGLTALRPQSSRPHTIATIFDAGTCEALRALLHQSPRTFGKPTSRWTLQLAAEIPYARYASLPSANHLLLAEEPAWEMLLQEFSAFMGWREEATARVQQNSAS